MRARQLPPPYRSVAKAAKTELHSNLTLQSEQRTPIRFLAESQRRHECHYGHSVTRNFDWQTLDLQPVARQIPGETPYAEGDERTETKANDLHTSQQVTNRLRCVTPR